MEEYKTIHFQEDESIGYITLNRPEKLNAFTVTMMSEMLDAFDHIDSKDSIKAVIITGEGRAFCAGADYLLAAKLLIQGLILQMLSMQILREILEAF